MDSRPTHGQNWGKDNPYMEKIEAKFLQDPLKHLGTDVLPHL